ncbi:hypothetical protein K435DRAFT_584257, partial [Dendrothele bispora CBS 962.96]
RYEVEREPIDKPPAAFLQHLLLRLKHGHPDLFRHDLRVTPQTFDSLVAAIEDDEVFMSRSELSPQAPVKEQLAVALYQFGHDSNASGLQSVANWSGLGKGTVHLYTRRVMTAILCPTFMSTAVRFPTKDERKEAKQWVKQRSCSAWKNGWCFVDGTLVPLAHRPYWYGESYFDRKCRYSLNIQIVSLPNLQIIDFAYGHTGSTHDATAWEETKLFKEHDTIPGDDAWVWADSAYPIQTWVVAPYKK